MSALIAMNRFNEIKASPECCNTHPFHGTIVFPISYRNTEIGHQPSLATPVPQGLVIQRKLVGELYRISTHVMSMAPNPINFENVALVSLVCTKSFAWPIRKRICSLFRNVFPSKLRDLVEYLFVFYVQFHVDLVGFSRMFSFQCTI